MLGAEFARAIAQEVGITVDDSAAGELAAHLQVHLWRTADLALKLARRARRRRRLLCADILDAAQHGWDQDASDAWVELLPFQALSGANEVLPLAETAARPRPVVPVEIRLRVEWLAVEGRAVVGCDGDEDDGAWLPRPPRQLFEMMHSPSVAELCLRPALQSLPLLDEEQLSLLRRIASVIDGGKDAARWRGPVLAICRREELAPLRPFLAHFLVHRVPLLVPRVSPAELRLILGVLEAISLAHRGAEVYLHQCLPTLYILCLSTSLGSAAHSGSSSGVLGPSSGRTNAAGVGSRAGSYRGVRKYAASVIAKIALRHRIEMPEVFAEVCATFGKALQRSPPLDVLASVLFGLTALGPACVEEVLAPPVLHALLADLAADAGAAGVNSPDDPFGAPSEVRTKKPRLVMSQVPIRLAGTSEDERADAFTAIVGAAVALVTAPPVGRGASRAALLCEGVAAAFGIDPDPFLAWLAATQGGLIERRGREMARSVAIGCGSLASPL